jgi:thiol:disulfide interchange protein DsbC
MNALQLLKDFISLSPEAGRGDKRAGRLVVRLLYALTGAAAAVLLLNLITQPAYAADDFPKDVLKGIDAMQRLPVTGFHVVESRGRLLLVSTNGHYVVTGGRLLDLWNQVEVRSVADLPATTRIPLARMGIDTQAMGGVSIGSGAAAAVTVFLDPASNESAKLLPQLRELSKRTRVDVVFLPAQPARANVSRALICDPQAAQAFLLQGRTPSPVSDQQRCGTEQLQRTRVTAQLLGIETVPFSIAANGVTLAGAPQNYLDFVRKNAEDGQ